MVFSKYNESHLDDCKWDMKLHFYAYESEQPNTEMIGVGDDPHPWRCSIVKGKVYDYDGWRRRMVFWVPR